MRNVIFSIDNENVPLCLAIFKQFFAGLQTEGKAKGNLIPIIGAYKGQTENSFLCKESDFWTHIEPAGFCDNQESILYITECNKKYADLFFLATDETQNLGSMHEVSEAEALASEAYSYRPDKKMFWIAKPGNPDTMLQSELPDPWDILAECESVLADYTVSLNKGTVGPMLTRLYAAMDAKRKLDKKAA